MKCSNDTMNAFFKHVLDKLSAKISTFSYESGNITLARAFVHYVLDEWGAYVNVEEKCIEFHPECGSILGWDLRKKRNCVVLDSHPKASQNVQMVVEIFAILHFKKVISDGTLLNLQNVLTDLIRILPQKIYEDFSNTMRTIKYYEHTECSKKEDVTRKVTQSSCTSSWTLVYSGDECCTLRKSFSNSTATSDQVDALACFSVAMCSSKKIKYKKCMYTLERAFDELMCVFPDEWEDFKKDGEDSECEQRARSPETDDDDVVSLSSSVAASTTEGSNAADSDEASSSFAPSAALSELPTNSSKAPSKVSKETCKAPEADKASNPHKTDKASNPHKTDKASNPHKTHKSSNPYKTHNASNPHKTRSECNFIMQGPVSVWGDTSPACSQKAFIQRSENKLVDAHTKMNVLKQNLIAVTMLNIHNTKIHKLHSSLKKIDVNSEDCSIEFDKFEKKLNTLTFCADNTKPC